MTGKKREDKVINTLNCKLRVFIKAKVKPRI